KKAQKAQKRCVLLGFLRLFLVHLESSRVQHEFPDLQLWCTEVDQQAVLDSTRTQIAEQLGDMIVRQGLAGLELHHQDTFHEKVGQVVTDLCSVLVEHWQRKLLLHVVTRLPETMGEGVLVDLLQMSVSKPAM